MNREGADLLRRIAAFEFSPAFQRREQAAVDSFVALATSEGSCLVNSIVADATKKFLRTTHRALKRPAKVMVPLRGADLMRRLHLTSSI